MKVFKITCPCIREHFKNEDGKKIKEEACGKLLNFIGVESESATLFEYCGDCKKLVSITFEDGFPVVKEMKKGTKLEIDEDQVVINELI